VIQASPWFGSALRAGLVALLAVLASCSGAVSGPAVSSGPIVISPSNAVLYSGLPTAFAVTGGNGTYIITSSDQNVLPVADTTSSNSFYVVPNDVGADTPVTLTVRDSSGSVQATASLTVKARTISNVVTITPSAGQATSCGTSLCAGGDAEVRVTLAQLGVPLAGRVVQFDVISGALNIITGDFAGTEVQTKTATATTDSSGTARVRVRADVNASAQTALLNITDRSSGYVQSAAVSIAPAASSALTALPTSIQFTGPNATTCANNVSADVIIVGGHPPYQVTKPAGFNVNPSVLTTSGGHVTVTATGQCARNGTPDAGQVMGIVDTFGATASVTIHNDPAPATTGGTFTVAPTAISLNCNQGANISIVGGTPPYYATSGNGKVVTAITSPGANGNYVGVITRASGPDSAPPTTTTSVGGVPTTTVVPIDVAFSDGQSVKTVAVTVNQGICP
jgi:hypothetical protein